MIVCHIVPSATGRVVPSEECVGSLNFRSTTILVEEKTFVLYLFLIVLFATFHLILVDFAC